MPSSAQGLTYLPICTTAISLGLMRRGRDADNSPLTSAKLMSVSTHPQPYKPLRLAQRQTYQEKYERYFVQTNERNQTVRSSTFAFKQAL